MREHPAFAALVSPAEVEPKRQPEIRLLTQARRGGDSSTCNISLQPHIWCATSYKNVLSLDYPALDLFSLINNLGSPCYVFLCQELNDVSQNEIL